MIPGQPPESLFPRGLGKVALHPRRPTTAIIPAALPSAAPPRLENQSRYEKVGLALAKRLDIGDEVIDLCTRQRQIRHRPCGCDRTRRRDDCWATKSGCSPIT